MPIVFVLAPVGGPTSSGLHQSRPQTGRNVGGILRSADQLERRMVMWGGSCRQGHSDRRSPSVVYVPEQMAFIYILQKRNELGTVAFYLFRQWKGQV